MSKNKVTSLAGRVLRDIKSSETQKRLAGCVLSTCNTNKCVSKEIRILAFNVSISNEYNVITKKLTDAILSQK